VLGVTLELKTKCFDLPSNFSRLAVFSLLPRWRWYTIHLFQDTPLKKLENVLLVSIPLLRVVTTGLRILFIQSVGRSESQYRLGDQSCP
jgi:hypothetical protein